MIQMEEVTQQAATNAEHSASSGEELNIQVNGLRDMVVVMETMVWGEGNSGPVSDDDNDDGYEMGRSAASSMMPLGPNQQPWMSSKERSRKDMPILSPLRESPKDHMDIELF